MTKTVKTLFTSMLLVSSFLTHADDSTFKMIKTQLWYSGVGTHSSNTSAQNNIDVNRKIKTPELLQSIITLEQSLIETK